MNGAVLRIGGTRSLAFSHLLRGTQSIAAIHSLQMRLSFIGGSGWRRNPNLKYKFFIMFSPPPALGIGPGWLQMEKTHVLMEMKQTQSDLIIIGPPFAGRRRGNRPSQNQSH